MKKSTSNYTIKQELEYLLKSLNPNDCKDINQEDLKAWRYLCIWLIKNCEKRETMAVELIAGLLSPKNEIIARLPFVFKYNKFQR